MILLLLLWFIYNLRSYLTVVQFSPNTIYQYRIVLVYMYFELNGRWAPITAVKGYYTPVLNCQRTSLRTLYTRYIIPCTRYIIVHRARWYYVPCLYTVVLIVQVRCTSYIVALYYVLVQGCCTSYKARVHSSSSISTIYTGNSSCDMHAALCTSYVPCTLYDVQGARYKVYIVQGTST